MEDTAGGGHRFEWWHRQTPLTRKIIRTTVVLLVSGVVALTVGVTTASTRSSLGPHEADYSMSLDSRISFHMGPLGAVLLESPLPGPLGVEVVVHQIPTDVERATAEDSPVPGLLADLSAYGQLVSHPEAAVADAVRGLVTDALGRTAVTWSLLLVAVAAGRLAAGGHLRDEMRRALAKPGVAVLAGAVLVGGTAAVVVPEVRRDEPDGYSPDVLDGTPLEGARITGRLADIVAVYGEQVREIVEENDAFYDLAANNLASALESEPEQPPVVGATVEAPQTPTGAETSPGEPTATGSPEADETSPTPQQSELDPVTFVMVADLHCNVGMATVIGTALEQTGAAALIDAGDTVVSGTSVESYCIDAFDRAVPDDVPVVVGTGNHDSITTAEQEREVGWTVLQGEIVEIAGVRFLGDTDPTLTAVGSGTVQEREETVDEMGERLAEIACEAEDAGEADGEGGARGVDVLLVHNPRAGIATLESSCANLQLSGHWHRTVGPEVFGSGVRYVSTSSGGGAGGGATVGPLSSDAEITIMRIDRTTGTPLDYRRVVIDTEAAVHLGEWKPFPVPPPDG
ncbi:hypothetical protein GCM10023169_38300 [Georgenia halophila]|uniref:Calcineurin-like phosphoesterase domain-containing protein n=1 Tax=Georgenia halophila TaxID=620889 RepID=A0ABP8LP42_9MICO